MIKECQKMNNLMRIGVYPLLSRATRILACGLSLIILAAMAGCSLFPKEPNPLVCLQWVNIALDHDANGNKATAVDLVYVHDEELGKMIGKIDSKTYFSSVDQLKIDHPGLLSIYHWELVPGQVLRDYKVEPIVDSQVWAAYIFASYGSKGAHRVRLGGKLTATLHLGAQAFCVKEVGCFDPGHRSKKLGRSQGSNLLKSDQRAVLGGKVPRRLGQQLQESKKLAPGQVGKELTSISNNKYAKLLGKIP